MFIYFNENRLAYHKGQLAPFFIAFIVVIIIAALVTINIGKIAKTKTYSSNAVDAGVLASASTMASAFNYIAVANSNMETNYQYFIGLATVSFLVGYVYMAFAMASAATALSLLPAACAKQMCCYTCVVPPVVAAACTAWLIACAAAKKALASAIASVKTFSDVMASLIIQVTGYWILQLYFYKVIRDNVDDYRQNAIDTGHSFAFSNSGVSSKLKGCRLGDLSLCNACEKACDRDCKAKCGDRSDYDDDEKDKYDDCMDVCTRDELNCLINNCWSQRAEYQLWVKDNTEDVPGGAVRTYSWLDSGARSHDVANQVMLDPVDDYVLTHTVLPFAAEIALLVAAMVFANKAAVMLAIAMAWVCPEPCFIAPVILGAQFLKVGALLSSIAAHAGLISNGTFTSSNDNDAWSYIICWIDSVPHNRLVDVYQTQRHQGADLGAWSTEYPLTTSAARASFAGNGKIYHPEPDHDASITLTDFLNSHLLSNLAEPIKDVEGEIE